MIMVLAGGEGPAHMLSSAGKISYSRAHPRVLSACCTKMKVEHLLGASHPARDFASIIALEAPRKKHNGIIPFIWGAGEGHREVTLMREPRV